MTIQPTQMDARIEKMKKTLPEGWRLQRRTRKLSSGPTTYLILTSYNLSTYEDFREIMLDNFPKAFLTSFGGGVGQASGTWRIDNFPEASNEGVDIYH